MQEDIFSPFEHLPQLVLTHILSYVSSSVELSKCSSVSRRWHITAQEDSIWRTIYLNTYDLRSEDMLDANTMRDLNITFNWRNELKRNTVGIPTTQIQVVGAGDEVWTATWSRNGQYLATGSSDDLCIIYILDDTTGMPQLIEHHRENLHSSVTSVDWSFCNNYVVCATRSNRAHIINVPEKTYVKSYPCNQFATHSRWLPDGSLIVGSTVSDSFFDGTLFNHHTLWRKFPFSDGKPSYRTCTTTGRYVHSLNYLPKTNSIAYETGSQNSYLLNFIYITRVSGNPLVSFEDDEIWKDRPFIKDITLVENGQMMGMTSIEGRWLLTAVRLFDTITPDLVPRVRAYCSEPSTTNYNQPSGLRDCQDALVPNIIDATPDVYEESLRTTTAFEADPRSYNYMPKLGRDFELHLWDLKELKLVKSYTGTQGYSSLPTASFVLGIDAGNPCLPYMTSGSQDGLYVFHIAHGPAPVKVMRDHTEIVNWTEFHPTRPLMVSASDDRTVRLWATRSN